MPIKTIFLDRDGVINQDVHYNYAGNKVLYLDFLKIFNKEY